MSCEVTACFTKSRVPPSEVVDAVTPDQDPRLSASSTSGLIVREGGGTSGIVVIGGVGCRGGSGGAGRLAWAGWAMGSTCMAAALSAGPFPSRVGT